MAYLLERGGLSDETNSEEFRTSQRDKPYMVSKPVFCLSPMNFATFFQRESSRLIGPVCRAHYSRDKILACAGMTGGGFLVSSE